MNVCVPGQAERRVTSLISCGHLLSRSSLCAVHCKKGHFHYHLRMATPIHRQMFACLDCMRIYTYVHLQPLLYMHIMCLYRYSNRSCSALCSQSLSLPFFYPPLTPFRGVCIFHTQAPSQTHTKSCSAQSHIHYKRPRVFYRGYIYAAIFRC